MNIGLFGFGCVGQGLFETLTRSGSVPATIVSICVKHLEKPRTLPANLFTDCPEDILDNPEIDVVLELIDDAEAAYHIVTRALRAGKAVVSANKKLLAEHFEELLELQRETGAPFLYEGAVCASIPIIRNLEEYYDNDLLQGVEGIFNGSSNYILSQIFQQNRDFQSALRQAQANGFAESDPTLDIDGHDAAYKLSLLTAHAFGQRIEPVDILRQGIRQVGRAEVEFAKEKGWKLKLVGQARRNGDRFFASVLPRFVATDDPLYAVENEYNGVLLEGAFSDVQFFRGKGAGSLPTGSAVLSDLSALGYDYQYEYRKYNAQELSLTDFRIRVYVRYNDPATIGALRFDEIEESYRSPKHRYVTGVVRASELRAFLASDEATDAFVAELPDSRAVSITPEYQAVPALN